MKKTISLVLCIILTLSLMSVAAFAQGLSNFQKTLTYTDGKFTDVSANDWFSMNVKAAYEYGLVNGVAANSFGAASNIKICEVVALAARLRSVYMTGSTNFAVTTPWYQSCVDYAISNEIISKGRFEDYNAYATRLQFAEIFAAALPSTALNAINDIQNGAIPDVTEQGAYWGVYTLYRAGIITGESAAGNFCPSENILRSEVAAIATRMVNESLRVKFAIEKASPGGTITTGTQLIEAVNSAKQAAALGLESYNTANLFAGTNDAMALAFLGKAKENATMAAQYSQNAAAFCKANSKYSTAYDNINNAYVACLQSTEYITLTASSLATAKWEYASKLLTSGGEALASAATTISAIG